MSVNDTHIISHKLTRLRYLAVVSMLYLTSYGAVRLAGVEYSYHGVGFTSSERSI